MRDAGSAVWLSKYQIFAVARFADVRDALRNWRLFTSSFGVGVDEEYNGLASGSLLTSDGPEHVALKKILGRPLGTVAMAALKRTIVSEAENIAERVAEMGTFDGVSDLAWHLPLAVVRQLVGLPDSGRDRMLEWGTAGFNALGPHNARTTAGRQLRNEMLEYMRTQAVPGKLRPGSWGAQLYEAGERGEIAPERCAREMVNYVGPSLDTTINATSSALWLFAQNPDQWDALRSDASLIPGAVTEALRVEAPVQTFTRRTTEDARVDDTMIPAASRVAVMFGSANRDERYWTNPDVFDIRRDARDQLAFGHGAHICLGMPLARLEIESLLAALARRVKRFTLGAPPVRALNNTLRGFQTLMLTAEVESASRKLPT